MTHLPFPRTGVSVITLRVSSVPLAGPCGLEGAKAHTTNQIRSMGMLMRVSDFQGMAEASSQASARATQILG